MPSGGAPFTVVQVREEDWQAYRDLRLEMLLDAPESFWTRYDQIADRGEEQWRHAVTSATTLQAVSEEGRPLGTLTVDRPRVDAGLPGTVFVLAVYVRPEARGRGVGDQLLRTAEQVAAEQFDAQRLLLHVSELNEPALALYSRHGYRPTGETIAHPRLAGVRELELAKPLR